MTNIPKQSDYTQSWSVFLFSCSMLHEHFMVASTHTSTDWFCAHDLSFCDCIMGLILLVYSFICNHLELHVCYCVIFPAITMLIE